ncbi:hypothetical protein KIF59_02645 [Enterobacter cloacae subsp. cloacae]|nr:hypothetical protein [Enterobacter cloacae subsp. cloacae]
MTDKSGLTVNKFNPIQVKAIFTARQIIGGDKRKDFTFYNPTRIEFGSGKEDTIGAYIYALAFVKFCCATEANVLNVKA